MIGTSFFIHQLVRCSLQKVENHYPDGLPEKIVLNSNDQFLWVGWVLNQAECCSKAASHWANLQLTNSFENMSSKWKYSPWALRLQETLEISKREKGMLEKTKENTRFFSLMWILFGFDLGSKQYSLLGSRCSEGTGNCKFSLGWGGSLAKSKQTKRLHESLPLWREGKSLPPSSSDIKGARPPTPTACCPEAAPEHPAMCGLEASTPGQAWTTPERGWRSFTQRLLPQNMRASF